MRNIRESMKVDAIAFRNVLFRGIRVMVSLPVHDTVAIEMRDPVDDVGYDINETVDQALAEKMTPKR